LLSGNDDFSRYTLQAVAQIGNELRLLEQRRDLISVFFGRGQNSFPSLIIDINVEARLFRFDDSADATLNAAVERSRRLVFIAMPLGIRIQFSIPGGIKTVGHHDSRPAFQADFPSSILKLQRRDDVRVQQPSAKRSLCMLLHPNGSVISMKLHDISVGGVGMLIQGGVTLDPMDICADCRIDLGAPGVVEVALEILYKREVVNIGGNIQTLVGARFIDLGADTEKMLRNYIGQVERERQRLRREF
jgi:c-di-GMP-binding flagellar brake protein YcgR